MFQRTAFGKCCLLLVLTISFRQCCAAAPRIFIDSRSTTRDPNDGYCGLMLRELPRQALIIALTPIIPKHAFDKETFDKTTLKPVIGSGPYTIAQVQPGQRDALLPRCLRGG